MSKLLFFCLFFYFIQPLTNLKTIKLLGSENLREVPDLSMATSLETLNLNNCSSLVELTLSSIQNLNKLTTLEMIGCSSLETLPSGINLESLYRLNLNGCSRLRSFPDISCNISLLFLNQTAIEEVPSQINNFSSLEALEMWECKELRGISSRIFKLQNLEEVFFSNCEKLAEVRWPEEEIGTDNAGTNFSLISFTDCFNLNHETFIQRSASKCLILPGEVPEYFTYQSTGSVLIIPLQHQSSRSQQSFLDFKVCVVVSDGSKSVNSIPCYIDIEVRCQFRNKHGNYSDPVTVTDLSFHQKYNHQIIFDCQIPLNQECDQVEVEFHLPYNVLKLERCGMRLLDDSTLSPATQNEADESRADNDGGFETAHGEEECGVSEDREI